MPTPESGIGLNRLPAYPSISTGTFVERPQKKPLARRILRRVGNGAAAGLLSLGLLNQINSELTNALWQPTPAGVEQISTPTPVGHSETFIIGNKTISMDLSQPSRKETNIYNAKLHSATFVLGGLGTINASEYAKAEQPALQKSGRVFAVIYPTDMSIPAIANVINETIREDKLTQINFDGVSTGGNIELDLLPDLHLKVNGGVRIDNLEFDDTPTMPDDIKDRNYKFPVWLYDHGFDGGGFLGKLAGQVWTHTWSDPNTNHSLKQQIAVAWDTTFNPVPPELWMEELDDDATRTMQKTVSDLSSVRYHSIIFIHPLWKDDTVVRVKLAGQQLRWAYNKATEVRHNETPAFINAKLRGNVPHASASYNHRDETIYDQTLAPVLDTPDQSRT